MRRHSIHRPEAHLVKLALCCHSFDREGQSVILLNAFHAEVEPRSVMAYCTIRHAISWHPAVEVFWIVLICVTLRQVPWIKLTWDNYAIRELEGILSWLTAIDRYIQNRLDLFVCHVLFWTSFYHFLLLSRFSLCFIYLNRGYVTLFWLILCLR